MPWPYSDLLMRQQKNWNQLAYIVSHEHRLINLDHTDRVEDMC